MSFFLMFDVCGRNNFLFDIINEVPNSTFSFLYHIWQICDNSELSLNII